MKIIGAAVLVLAFAISAQAQSGRGASPHFTAAPSIHTVSGAGAGGGASAGGSRVLPHFAPTQFAVRSAAGSSSDYIPSTFVTWAKAVAEGKAALAARPEPLRASVHPAAKTAPMKLTSAKTRIGQSQNGVPAIETH